MSRYTENDGQFLRDGSTYLVINAVVWEVGRKGSGLFFAVPAQTRFDVTIPVGLRWAFSPHDRKFLKAAALHDTMLNAGWSRLTAGAEFAEALRADGVGKVKRFAMWFAVSLYEWA